MKQFPILTLGLCLLACALMALPEQVHQALYFNQHSLALGKLTGLITGHWMHADSQHLIWNVTALGILASAIESHSSGLG